MLVKVLQSLIESRRRQEGNPNQSRVRGKAATGENGLMEEKCQKETEPLGSGAISAMLCVQIAEAGAWSVSTRGFQPLQMWLM